MNVLQVELMVMKLVQDEPSIASACVLQSPSNAAIVQDKHSVHDQKANSSDRESKPIPMQFSANIHSWIENQTEEFKNKELCLSSSCFHLFTAVTKKARINYQAVKIQEIPKLE